MLCVTSINLVFNDASQKWLAVLSTQLYTFSRMI
jgi:hypothetical protein